MATTQTAVPVTIDDVGMAKVNGTSASEASPLPLRHTTLTKRQSFEDMIRDVKFKFNFGLDGLNMTRCMGEYWDDAKTVEHIVLKNLKESQNGADRPVQDISKPIVVKVSLTIINILDLDTKKQELVMNVWFDLRWKNELISWNPHSCGGMKSIKTPSSDVWLPDIILYNNADNYREEIDYDKYRASCSNDGMMYWPMPTQLRSTCKIDVTYFPFDSQHCHLRFGSWMYSGSELNITNGTTEVNLSNYIPSGEFKLVKVHQKRRATVKKHGAASFPEIVFYIHLERNTLYYKYTMIIPCMLISALTMLVFCLPPTSGEKIALGVTVLLAFSVFLISIGEKLPEISGTIPLIGMYLTIIMTITCVSVVMTVVVLRIDSTIETDKPLPPVLKWLLLGKLRRLLRMELVNRRGANRRRGLYDPDHMQPLVLLIQSTTGTGENGHSSEEQKLCWDGRKESTEEPKEENDWRKAARVIDRLLFWVFVFATVGVTLLMLVIIPLFAFDEAVENPEDLDDVLYGLTLAA